MIKNVTPFTPEIQRETNAKIQKGATLSLCLGVAVMLAYIFIPSEAWWTELLLYLGAMGLFFGILFLLTVKNANRIGNSQRITLTEYEFEEDYFILRNFRGEEKVAEMKVEYRELFKVKTTPSYILLFFLPSAAHPVDKRTMSAEDAAWILARADKGAKLHALEWKNNNRLEK